MKKMLIGLLLLLTGCATTANYEKTLNTWVGASESSLVDQWGPPSSVYESSGVKYLTFNKSRSGYVPGVAPSYQTTYVGNTAYTSAIGGSAGYGFTNSCSTTFTIRNNLVTSWRWEGNACRSN